MKQIDKYLPTNKKENSLSLPEYSHKNKYEADKNNTTRYSTCYHPVAFIEEHLQPRLAYSCTGSRKLYIRELVGLRRYPRDGTRLARTFSYYRYHGCRYSHALPYGLFIGNRRYASYYRYRADAPAPHSDTGRRSPFVGNMPKILVSLRFASQDASLQTERLPYPDTSVRSTSLPC